MKIEITDMKQSHVDAVERLEKECFSRPWTRQGLEEELENGNAHFLVACADGETVGYIGIIECFESCEITNVAVTEKFRRSGVAAALITQAEKGARERKREFITLEVRPSNTAALSLYSKLGFMQQGRRKNFYSEPVEDALIMTKFFKD